MANNSKQSGSQLQKCATSERPRLARNRLFESALRSAINHNKQPPAVPVNDRPPRVNRNPVPHQVLRNGAPRVQTVPRLASYQASKPLGRKTTSYNRSESSRDSVVHQKSGDRQRSSGYDPRPQCTMPNVSKTERSASSRYYSREEKNRVAQEVSSVLSGGFLNMSKTTEC